MPVLATGSASGTAVPASERLRSCPRIATGTRRPWSPRRCSGASARRRRRRLSHPSNPSNRSKRWLDRPGRTGRTGRTGRVRRPGHHLRRHHRADRRLAADPAARTGDAEGAQAATRAVADRPTGRDPDRPGRRGPHRRRDRRLAAHLHRDQGHLVVRRPGLLPAGRDPRRRGADRRRDAAFRAGAGAGQHQLPGRRAAQRGGPAVPGRVDLRVVDGHRHPAGVDGDVPAVPLGHQHLRRPGQRRLRCPSSSPRTHDVR